MNKKLWAAVLRFTKAKSRKERDKAKFALNNLYTNILVDVYDSGFADSGEGWNGEYPGNAMQDSSYLKTRQDRLEGL